MKKKYRYFRWMLGISALSLGLLSACGQQEAVYISQVPDSQTEMIEEQAAVTECDSCYVYVCGQVKNPGVYELSRGSRVQEAILLAGGMTENARQEAYNLAQCVEDGQMIYIPSVDEENNQSTGPEEETTDGRIDLNKATKEQLMSIPGVGESKASSILAYRSENGSFQSTEEIMNITGIKEGLYTKIKDYISVGK